jgi:hypothetical protein
MYKAFLAGDFKRFASKFKGLTWSDPDRGSSFSLTGFMDKL